MESKNKNMARNPTSGFVRLSVILLSIAGLIAFIIFRIGTGSADALHASIRSGTSGYCLDDYKDGLKSGNKVLLWGCNTSSAQDWTVSGDRIKHGTSCLTVRDNQKTSYSPVVIADCDATAPGQVWLKDKTSYFNPNSTMCLTAPRPKQPVVIAPCGSAHAGNQTWTPVTPKTTTQADACHGSEGELVACYAEREWVLWQSGTVSHEDLLAKYTDGAPYEAWCADFVSYVYKEAGHPFTQAYDGWDENTADAIQNYGFTMHLASSGYIPKPGDIAYFDYIGGHVELVVSGGSTPTFIYGNSGTIDPTTGNGQMKANTIVDDQSDGKLVYYLSPV